MNDRQKAIFDQALPLFCEWLNRKGPHIDNETGGDFQYVPEHFLPDFNPSANAPIVSGYCECEVPLIESIYVQASFDIYDGDEGGSSTLFVIATIDSTGTVVVRSIMQMYDTMMAPVFVRENDSPDDQGRYL